MSGNTEHIADLEQGSRGPESVSLDDLGAEAWSRTFEGHPYHNPRVGTTSNSSWDGIHEGAHKGRRDFDDGANALWSLYGKMAETNDEARFLSLAGDMDAVGFFAALFSAVLASFLVQSIPNLQVNPAEQSVYYQNQSVYYQQQSAYYQQQSVAILAQISQQIASIAAQVSSTHMTPPISTPPTVPLPSVLSTAAQQVVASTVQQISIPSPSPSPFPIFTPSLSDIRVNVFWLASLVCILWAAVFVFFIKRWVRAYMGAFQHYDHPLRRARFRQFLFEGDTGFGKLANAVPRLVHLSLFLFFWGLGDSMMNTNTAAGATFIFLNCSCTFFYVYCVSGHLKDLKSPYKTLLWRPAFSLMQKLPYFGARFHRKWRTPMAYQDELVMEETEERKCRDVRAIQWLVDKAALNAEMEPLVLAIPGTFNTEWGREVWLSVSNHRSDTDTLEPQTDHSPAGGPALLMHHPSRLQEGTAGDTICRSIRYLFETCKNHSYFENEEARHRRMRACVEATATFVCCIDFQLDWFGEVDKLVSEIGHIEMINQSPTTTSDQSFIIRWTCLSLVAVQQILRAQYSNRLQVLAGYAVSGMARFQSDYRQPAEAEWRGAQRIEECLKIAWKRVEELRQEFEPWTQKKTREQVEEILRKHERQIAELERIKVEADAMEDVDWRISLYQNKMDEATFRLTRQLPGVSFDELRRTESFLISDAFITQATGSTPVTPQLIFPGQQVRALARLGIKLREVLDGNVADGHQEVLESLKSVDQVLPSLRRPDGLMKRQLWRLQDLRDGGGLGFTIELFFLSLRRLLPIISQHESNSVLYIGAFKIITSSWKESKESFGTRHILLNIICDLIIQGRGVFSDFLYPEPITTILVDMVGKMLQGYAGPDERICDAVQEIENAESLICMDMRLRGRALAALPRFHDTSQVP